MTFRKLSVIPFPGKEVPNLTDPLRAVLSLGTVATVTCYSMHLRKDLVQV